MLLRTHLALMVLIVSLFISKVNSQFLFVAVCLIATMLPDIDTGFSTLGKMKGFRPLQFFTRHRGMIHSFTFCIVISILLAVFWPSASFAFFLGYSVHLFLDSFTKDGIMPFWPCRKTSSGFFKTGSLTETTIFLVLVFADILLILFKFFS